MVQGAVGAITMASSGIGRAMALRLANVGAKVVLGARGESGITALVDEIKAKAARRLTGSQT